MHRWSSITRKEAALCAQPTSQPLACACPLMLHPLQQGCLSMLGEVHNVWEKKKSLLCHPKMHWAGDSFMLGSGILRYWRISCWKEFTLRLPCGSVLLGISCLMAFTLMSALRLGWERQLTMVVYCPFLKELLCRSHHNSWPPSVTHSSWMPLVANVPLGQ